MTLAVVLPRSFYLKITHEMDILRNPDRKTTAPSPSNSQHWSRPDSIKELAAALLFFAAFGILPQLLISP